VHHRHSIARNNWDDHGLRPCHRRSRRMPPTLGVVFRHMTFPAITAHPDLDVSEAIVLMKSKDVDHLPVVDGGRLLGVVSYRSMAMYLDPSQLMLPASSAA
jgi:CBS domain-containing protein